MAPRPYTKPATTYIQQIELLKSRGMTFADEAAAQFYLQHINYYRLVAYWLPFEADHATHRFNPGTTFEAVLELYKFDRELRLLLLDAIERIEVSARAQWAHYMGHSHGAHSQLDARLAYNHTRWQRNMDDLQKEVNRSEETFIRHFTSTYSEPMPPVWAVCEVMSLGLLSRWFANLKPMQTRSKIAHVYGVDERVLQSWLHHLSVVRNVCAHHSRLWNRDFSKIPPKEPHSKPLVLKGQFIPAHKLYNTFLILLYLMDTISPAHHWRGRLKQLLNGHPQWLREMGFQANWETHSIWRQ